MARRVAQMSHATRLQVGSIIVKDGRIISMGWNGMPSGWDNDCEYRVWMDGDAGGWLDPSEIEHQWPFVEYSDYTNADGNPHVIGRYHLKSKPEVLHSERNAIDKLARSHESGVGATLYVTTAPCLECAKSIYGAGITEVWYDDEYRSLDGIKFLNKCNVPIKKI